MKLKALANLLNRSEWATRVYLCRGEFEHVKILKKGKFFVVEYITDEDIDRLKVLMKRTRGRKSREDRK